MSYLAPILARKRRELARRRRHLRGALDARRDGPRPSLARPVGERPRIIAEVKFRSPSAGPIRPWTAGEGRRVAMGYAAAGADAISVLCDGPGFGGSPLELRRIARAVSAPVLFKEFVLDPLQLDLAVRCGASLVLLLVAALDDAELGGLVDEAVARGLEPVVEAASGAELTRALGTRARVVGVNARDLRTFRVDPAQALALVEKIPNDRVAVYMSGVESAEDMRRVAGGRADALLVGTGLMRAPDPGARLAGWLEEAAR